MTWTQLQQRFTRKHKIRNRRRHALAGSPQRKATCKKVIQDMPPRKPNSANRKVAWVMFSSKRWAAPGTMMRTRYHGYAYIEGMSHNLRVHSQVLVRGGRCKDLPGVCYTTIRGKFDLQRLVLRRKGRSKYGARLPGGDLLRQPYHKHQLW